MSEHKSGRGLTHTWPDERNEKIAALEQAVERLSKAVDVQRKEIERLDQKVQTLKDVLATTGIIMVEDPEEEKAV